MMIEVKNLSKNYGTVNALCDVSFALEKGKILGLVGDNGAGKSTLLKILSGNVQPSAGEIYIEGKITRFRGPADAIRMGIATAHQFLELVGTATAWENFFIGREQTRKRGPFAFLDIHGMRHSAAEAIARYGITFDIDKEVDDLSGEERQIIAVARSIDTNPRILLLDESFTFLSLQGRGRVLDFLRSVNEKDAVTMIIVSHDLDLVNELAHCIMVLRGGRRVFFGRTGEITVDEIVEYMLP